MEARPGARDRDPVPGSFYVLESGFIRGKADRGSFEDPRKKIPKGFEAKSLRLVEGSRPSRSAARLPSISPSTFRGDVSKGHDGHGHRLRPISVDRGRAHDRPGRHGSIANIGPAFSDDPGTPIGGAFHHP